MQQGGASSSTDMSVDPVGPVLVTSPAGEDKMSVDEVSRLIEVWVNEFSNAGEGGEYEENMQIMQEAWDDVHGGELHIGEVEVARGEEVGYMVNRGIWSEVPIGESCEKTGKALVSVRWVDVNKGGEGAMEVVFLDVLCPTMKIFWFAAGLDETRLPPMTALASHDRGQSGDMFHHFHRTTGSFITISPFSSREFL